MRIRAMLLTIILSFGAAVAGTPATAAGWEPNQPALVKYYYGLPGSNDYVLGPAGSPQATDAWQRHSKMPAIMMDNAAAANASHVYVAAGFNVGKVFYRCPVGGTTWQTLAQCPLELCTGGAAIIGDTFYYCGGYKGGMSQPADTLYKYSISGNNWTSAPGPFPGTPYNWSPTIVACAGKLYYISGCSEPGASNPTTQVWRYTPGAGWSQMANLNRGRVFAHAVSYRDTIWLAGGIADGIALTHTEFYDPVANRWTVNNSVFPQLPEGRWGGAAAQTANLMLVATGVSAAGNLTDSVFVFNFSSRNWSVEEGVTTRVYRTAGCGTPDGKAFVCGGSVAGFTPTDEVQYNTYSAPPAHDVKLAAIIAPGSRVIPGTPVQPIASVQNAGSSAESGIPVTCVIDSAGTQIYSRSATLTGPLAPGASAQVSFSPNWTPGPANAIYRVRMWTSLVGDSNRANDTLTQTTRSTNQITALWLWADDSPPDTLAARLLALGDSLVSIDIRGSTPALDTLRRYPVVGVHTNYPPADSVALGNVLADYVDAGGGVVIGQFGFTSGWHVAGRIMTGNYATIGKGANTQASTTLGWKRSSHPMMAGVDSVREYFAATAPFVTADSVAKWADGRPYVAVSANQKVIGVNSYPGYYQASPPQRGGDWALVFHNALQLAGGLVGMEEFDPLRPALFCRIEATPNPAHSRVLVNYAVSWVGPMELGIYDLDGRLVKTVFRGDARSGSGQAVWDMSDRNGRRVARGIYFCRLTAGQYRETAKIVVE